MRCWLFAQGHCCIDGTCSKSRLLQGHPGLLRQQCAILREVRFHAERSPDGQLHAACCLVADTDWLLQRWYNTLFASAFSGSAGLVHDGQTDSMTCPWEKWHSILRSYNANWLLTVYSDDWVLGKRVDDCQLLVSPSPLSPPSCPLLFAVANVSIGV